VRGLICLMAATILSVTCGNCASTNSTPSGPTSAAARPLGRRCRDAPPSSVVVTLTSAGGAAGQACWAAARRAQLRPMRGGGTDFALELEAVRDRRNRVSCLHRRPPGDPGLRCLCRFQAHRPTSRGGRVRAALKARRP
jgi:hypothetical protein